MLTYSELQLDPLWLDLDSLLVAGGLAEVDVLKGRGYHMRNCIVKQRNELRTFVSLCKFSGLTT